ncbi:MAG: acyltransferase family protein [Bauldia sp.]|nr:acyltransferase family protein [Bauldia sp.]
MSPWQNKQWMFLERLSTRPDRTDSGIDATVIFVLAIALVVNSHLEAYYPVPWLAADGLLGNSLFFLCSGFAAQRSLMAKPQPFARYYARRLLRIYPAVIAAILLGMVLGTIGTGDGWRGIVDLFVWPTPFTYVSLIMPFYAFIWCINVRGAGTALIASAPISLIVAMGINIASGDLGPDFNSQDISWYSYTAFFWCCTASGLILARGEYTARFSRPRLVLLLGAIGLYLFIKYQMIIGVWSGLLAPVLFALVFFSVVLAMLCLGDVALVRRLLSIGFTGRILALIANLTLEIYVIHSVLHGALGISSIFFPANIVTLCVVTLAAAIALRRALDFLLVPRRAAVPGEAK